MSIQNRRTFFFITVQLFILSDVSYLSDTLLITKSDIGSLRELTFSNITDAVVSSLCSWSTISVFMVNYIESDGEKLHIYIDERKSGVIKISRSRVNAIQVRLKSQIN